MRVHADNIYIMGHSREETISRWERVLQALEDNNLKLSHKKTSCFPQRLDLLGWIKEGKFLLSDPDRQNILLSCTKPTTIKELRSFLGSYHTFYKCHKQHNMILSPLTKILSQNLSTNQKIEWTLDLVKAFQTAQAAAKNFDKLYSSTPPVPLTSWPSPQTTLRRAPTCRQASLPPSGPWRRTSGMLWQG